MKNLFSLFTVILLFLLVSASAQWKPAGEKIRTGWADDVDPASVWDAYPRPLLKRNDWKNLNGLWNYSINPRNIRHAGDYDGEILVPFPVESSLSGVKKEVGENNVVWYERSFTVPSGWKGKDILLHFGAVDWQADVWINDIKIGSHTGGYTAFNFNITPYLNPRGDQKLVVRVWDPTDESFQPRGKQVTNPGGIWYTAVTGIWQTVWIEPVEKNYIKSIKTTPDIDLRKVNVEISSSVIGSGNYAEVRVTDEGRTVASEKFTVSGGTDIYIDTPKLWTPESPFLYDMEITLYSAGEVVDKVDSYFAMRKISTARDESGIVRFQLNNEDYFPMGTLDQGWWPDGLYTAPSDAALLNDIKVTKELGFNMIRKHVKVEPARWYTHCDREGIIVWQDMPSGDETPVWQRQQYFDGVELQRSARSEENYRKEWKAIMDLLYSHPSIVTWIPFNEGWGQFKTVEIANWTKQYDPSRLVLPASGGNHFQTGDILGIHNYPQPRLYLYDATRPTALSEYGGIGLVLEGHLWEPERNWGYVQFNTIQDVTDKYLEYAEELKKLIKAGLSAAVYTQITDVEIEVNGLMTYDRKRIKMDMDRVRQANSEIRAVIGER
ncbi:MAG: glycoside hydrolase family 2 protein [Bacteroidales bacterium]